MTSQWTKIVLAAVQFHSVLCVQFAFTPQNTYLHKPAVYQCTVDINGVSITWTVNGDSSTHLSITSLGIVTQGAATQNSTLTIPGEATLNETIVRCIASGFINGEVYVNTSSDVLYIQGPPAPPKITCSPADHYNKVYNTMQYEVKCNWTVPYTIPGVEISGYEVNITRGDEILMQQQLVTDTEIAYVRGDYNVSVVAVIGDNNDLMGEVNTTEVIDEDLNIVCDYLFTLEVRNLDGKWMANCSVNINDIKFAIEPPIPSLMSVIDCPSDSSLTCEQYKIMETIERNSAEVDRVVELPDNEERIISVSVHYNSGLNVNSNHHRLISTFDVQGVNITQNSSIGQVCFNCSYADGSSAKGCFIEYSNLRTELSGNLSILRAEGIKCVTGIIITGDYSISVYDIESNGTMHTVRPAYQMTTRIENMLVILDLSSISSSLSSSLHSGRITPTLIPPDKSFRIVIVGVTTAGSILLIILLVVVVSLLFYIFKCAKSKNCKPVYPNHSSMDLEVHSTPHINYTETVPNSNGPKPTLSTANVSSFPYSDVHHGPQPIQHEEYSRLNRRNPASHSNNGVYSKLHGTDTKQTKAASTSSEYSTLHQNSSVSGYTIQPVTSGYPSTTLTYSFVVSLVAQIPHKWKEFGNILAITPTKLIEIRENHPNDDHRAFCDVIQEWQTSGIRSFTLDTLKMILDRIGEGNRLVEHAEL